jgi:hypothetical protein
VAVVAQLQQECKMPLRADDLEYMVKKVFEIDSFKSKIGTDEDICTLSFTVDEAEPAKDLVHFIEMGFSFVLDADASAGEMDDGKYRVYVEIERTRHIGEQVMEIIEGVKKLAALDEMRFRYFKSFKSELATVSNLSAAIPKNKEAYRIATKEREMDNVDNFFSTSLASDINVVDESITFKKTYSGPITFNIIDSGLRSNVYERVTGPIMMESSSMAEVMFLTKVIGNYNINKIGNSFVFENNGWAVTLQRK